MHFVVQFDNNLVQELFANIKMILNCYKIDHLQFQAYGLIHLFYTVGSDCISTYYY